MRVYAFSNSKGGEEATQILEEMKFPLDKPWKYDPFFMIVVTKGNKKLERNAIESRLS